MPRFNKFDICLAWYFYASNYHEGQASKLYRVFGRLERIKFQPGFVGDNVEKYFARMLCTDEDRRFDVYENARAIYESLAERRILQ